MKNVGERAPAIPAVTWPAVLWFFKAECPTCEYTLPYAERLYAAYPGIQFYGIAENNAADARDFGATFPLVLDDVPCPISVAYKVAYTPTMFVVDANGVIAEAVEAWSRDGYNHASATIATLLGTEPVTIADEKASAMRYG